MNRRPNVYWAGALLLLVAAGCGTGGSGSSSYRSDLITSEEIAEASGTNAYQIVRQLRPAWLRGRGAQSVNAEASLPVVYVHQMRYGDVSTLRDFARGDLVELRFVDAATATTRYGTGHGGGVIEVVTRS